MCKQLVVKFKKKMLLQSKTTFLFKFPQGVTLPPHPEKDFEDWQKYLFVCLFVWVFS